MSACFFFQPSNCIGDIALTSVIQMVRSGQIREIEVNGDILSITTLDENSFMSRKWSGSNIVDILNDAGIKAGTVPKITVKEKSQLSAP